MVRLDDKLLIINDEYTETLRIPTTAPTGQESGQCAAHRIMWETAGFNVQVGKLLGENASGTQYFQCRLDASFDEPFDTWPLPPWSPLHNASLAFVDPFEVQPTQWDESQELVFVRTLFNQASSQQPIAKTPVSD